MRLTPSDVRAALQPAMTVDITTMGRRSGMPTRIEIWMFEVDRRFVITGTPGPRDWYANLLDDARLTVHLDGSPSLDLRAVANPVIDAAFRRRVFEAPHTTWYRSQTSIDDLVANSPMVELSFLALE